MGIYQLLADSNFENLDELIDFIKRNPQSKLSREILRLFTDYQKNKGGL